MPPWPRWPLGKVPGAAVGAAAAAVVGAGAAGAVVGLAAAAGAVVGAAAGAVVGDLELSYEARGEAIAVNRSCYQSARFRQLRLAGNEELHKDLLCHYGRAQQDQLVYFIIVIFPGIPISYRIQIYFASTPTL